jgi:hypothetical protein
MLRHGNTGAYFITAGRTCARFPQGVRGSQRKNCAASTAADFSFALKQPLQQRNPVSDAEQVPCPHFSAEKVADIAIKIQDGIVGNNFKDLLM